MSRGAGLSREKYHRNIALTIEHPDEHGFRVRCVSGERVLHPVLGRLPMGADGYCRVSITKLTGLVDLVRFWNCPVTFSPPDQAAGTPFWSLELEDGLHAKEPKEDE